MHSNCRCAVFRSSDAIVPRRISHSHFRAHDFDIPNINICVADDLDAACTRHFMMEEVEVKVRPRVAGLISRFRIRGGVWGGLFGLIGRGKAA